MYVEESFDYYLSPYAIKSESKNKDLEIEQVLKRFQMVFVPYS
jgi:hypothetical protein